MDERNEKLTSLSSELLKYLQAQQQNPTPEFVNFIAGQCKAAQNMPYQDVTLAVKLALGEFSNSSKASNVSGILPDQPIDFSHFTSDQFEQIQEQVLGRVRDIVAKFAAEDTEHKVFAANFCAKNDVILRTNGRWGYNKIFLYDSKDDRELMCCYLKQADYLWIAMRNPSTPQELKLMNSWIGYEWYKFNSLASIDALDFHIRNLIEYYNLLDIKDKFEGW